MRRVLLPLLAVVLLGTSGCVAAVVAAVGAGAGLGYAQTKKSNAAAKQNAATQPANGKSQPKSVEPLPAPGEFVDCQLTEGVKLAMSATDCKAKGGTPS